MLKEDQSVVSVLCHIPTLNQEVASDEKRTISHDCRGGHRLCRCRPSEGDERGAEIAG